MTALDKEIREIEAKIRGSEYSESLELVSYERIVENVLYNRHRDDPIEREMALEHLTSLLIFRCHGGG